jgi:hypothetical protein
MNHTPRSATLFALGVTATIAIFFVLAIKAWPILQAAGGDSPSDTLLPWLSTVVYVVNYSTSMAVAKVMSVIFACAGFMCFLIQYFLRNNDTKSHQPFKLTIRNSFIWMMFIGACWSVVILARAFSAGDFENDFGTGMLAVFVTFLIFEPY